MVSLGLSFGLIATVLALGLGSWSRLPDGIKPRDYLTIGRREADTGAFAGLTVSDYTRIVDAMQEGMWAFAHLWPVQAILHKDGREEAVEVRDVSLGYFQLLGVPAGMGSLAAPEGGVVLSSDSWRRIYDSGDVVGQPFDLDGERTRTIVGVASQEFGDVFWGKADAWILNTGTDYEVATSSGIVPYDKLVLGFVESDEAGALPSLLAEYRFADTLEIKNGNMTVRYGNPVGDGDRLAVVSGLEAWPDRRSETQGRLASLAVVVVLLLALSVFSLGDYMAVRTEERWKDNLIRLAVGATPGDLFRESLAANALLLVPILILAVASFAYLVDVVLRVEPFATTPGELSGRAGGWALVVTGTLLVFAFSASVAWGLRRVARVTGIVSTDHHVDRAIRRFVQRILLAAAVAGLMLAGSALIRYVVDAGRTFGFGRPDVHVLLPLEMHGSMFSDGEVAALNDLIESIPGVESVAQAELTPLMSLVALPTARVEVHVAGGGFPGTDRTFFRNAVSPSYFGTIGAQIMAGRVFSASTNEVVVSRAAAAVLGEDPAEVLGLPIAVSAAGEEVLCTVVGVVADIDYGEYDDEERLVVYQNWEHRGVYGDWVVRHRTDPSRLVDAVRSLTMVGEVMDLGTPIEAFRAQFVTRRSAETILGFASMFAMVLAFSGVGASVSRSLAQARRSMGVRLAVGATVPELVRNYLVPLIADVAIVTCLICAAVIGIKLAVPELRSVVLAWLAAPTFVAVLLTCSLLTYFTIRGVVESTTVRALMSGDAGDHGEATRGPDWVPQ